MSRQDRALSCLVLAGVVLTAGCTPQDQRIQQHREALHSLGATTAAIGEAWMAGDVSGTYARTALEQTFRLVEQERSALARSPESLLDPQGAQLSQDAEKLSRLLASMIGDVRASNAKRR